MGGEAAVAEGGHPTRQALQAIYHAACVEELEAATQLPGMANHKVTLQAVLQVWNPVTRSVESCQSSASFLPLAYTYAWGVMLGNVQLLGHLKKKRKSACSRLRRPCTCR